VAIRASVVDRSEIMNSAAIDTDVLIVGAGPVGLFLANECARRGLRWRIVETRPSQSEHSKALAIMPRTVEIFDMAGVAGPFLEVANRVTGLAVIEPSRTVARMRFTPEESPYSFVAMVPQDVTEKLLVQEVRRKGGAVEYETTFVSAGQHDEHVDVTLSQKGQPLKLSARFVVGCDGAHSAVRHLLNLPFEGQAYEASCMLADSETNEALPPMRCSSAPANSVPWQSSR
jgi:2-polyprenyl-6-methoxyphenol hydroxylase-like FAD-dependent oxidoreductase